MGVAYPTARTLNGTVVLAKTAERSDHFVCLDCEYPMVLRRGTVKQPHFAHKGIPPTCNQETVLHSSFKHLLYERLLQHLDTAMPLMMTWECPCCRQQHDGNLLKTATTVKLEHALDLCRPDLCLFNAVGQPTVMLEVVVTHAPEPHVYQTCVEQQLQLVIFELHSFEDLQRLQQEVLNPNWVSVCKDPTAVGSLKYRERLDRAPSGLVWDAELVWEKVKARVPRLIRIFLDQHCWITGFYQWQTWIGVDSVPLAKMARQRYVPLMTSAFEQVLGMPYEVDFTGYPNLPKPSSVQPEGSLTGYWQDCLSRLPIGYERSLVKEYATLVAVKDKQWTISLHPHLLSLTGFVFLVVVLKAVYAQLSSSCSVVVVNQVTGQLVPALSDSTEAELDDFQ